MSLTTGGRAMGATSTRSSSESWARRSASPIGTMPTCSPSGPTRRTSGTRIRSLIRGSVMASPLLLHGEGLAPAPDADMREAPRATARGAHSPRATSPGARAHRGPGRWPGSAIRDLDALTAPGGSGLLLVERPGAGPLSGSRASCSGEARRYYSVTAVEVIPPGEVL